VAQAGSVLPLSSNTRLDAELGTRHRAAVGITEETDAVAVVVSEERGEMSLCFHGNIARDLDAATLRKALLGLFYREKGKKRRIAEEAKAAAAAAHGMFAFALRDTKPRTAITVPEEAEANAAAGAEPREPGPKSERQTRPDVPAQTPPRPRTAPPEAG
jgi:hypothetical protein